MSSVPPGARRVPDENIKFSLSRSNYHFSKKAFCQMNFRAKYLSVK
jgi:hypothetical protein